MEAVKALERRNSPWLGGTPRRAFVRYLSHSQRYEVHGDIQGLQCENNVGLA